MNGSLNRNPKTRSKAKMEPPKQMPTRFASALRTISRPHTQAAPKRKTSTPPTPLTPKKQQPRTLSVTTSEVGNEDAEKYHASRFSVIMVGRYTSCRPESHIGNHFRPIDWIMLVQTLNKPSFHVMYRFSVHLFLHRWYFKALDPKP